MSWDQPANHDNVNWGAGAPAEAPTDGFGGDRDFEGGDERKGGGECFNCGQEGHNKADCPNPRVFKGECRHCGVAGHPAAECPDKPAEVCKNCKQEGHKTMECTAKRAIDFSGVETKTSDEAWADLQAADKEHDLDSVRDALKVYHKALPDMDYVMLEKAFRRSNMNTHIIAYEKEVTDTYTLMDMSGRLDCKYHVGFYWNFKCPRAALKESWPKDEEDNMARLSDAGIPVDRGIPKCTNCEELGHIAKSCPQEKRERERVMVKCLNCDEIGHRVRDCPKERPNKFACRNCGQKGHNAKDCTEPRSAEGVECKVCSQTGHFARDCPDRPKQLCRNCNHEGHRASDCTNERVLVCRNCDEEGHMSKECPKPRDYTRVKCQNCGEMGHTKVRCKQPPKEEEEVPDSGDVDQGGTGQVDGYGASSNWESYAMGQGNDYVAPQVTVGSSTNDMW